MKKFMRWMLVAILICGASVFTSCSSDDDGDEKKVENLTAEMLAGLWVTDYAASGTEGDLSWTRVLEDYQFKADGTGYYECYRLDGEKFVKATAVRDNDSLHYTLSGNTVTITGDKNNMRQTLTYADGKLTMVNGQSSMVNGQFTKATTEQQTLVEQLYAEWQSGNSGTTNDITYIERSWDGNKVVDKEVTTKAQWLNEIQVTPLSEKPLTGAWYVTGTHLIKGMLKVEKDKTLDLILCDDCNLTVQLISVEGGTLRIFAQSRHTGKLNAGNAGGSGLWEGAAIGPRSVGGGTVEIHGGNVTAQAGNYGAGIGGYKRIFLNRIAIFGDDIYAEGGVGAAGIGGGSDADKPGGKIEIYGGSITAYGGVKKQYSDTQKAETQGGGSGIGGGCAYPMETVAIYGGNIKAYGKFDAAGIGGGQCGVSTATDEKIEKYANSTVIISGGYVEAHGANYAAGIGGGDGMHLGEIRISGGEVKAYAGADAAGIGGGEGAIGGYIAISGGKVFAYGNVDEHGNGAGIGSGQDANSGTIHISGGEVHAYGGPDAAGIGTGEGSAFKIAAQNITISGGFVEARGGDFGAGIGGGQDASCYNITISGGEVHAYGGDDAAGIGTGEETTLESIYVDNITITGGAIEAVGGGYGAGIGAGQDAEVGTITITNESGSVYVSGRSGNDCGWWAGAIGAYDEDDRGTLNIGKGVKVLTIEKDYSWSTIPVQWNPVVFVQQRCHAQLLTCDHPGGHTAETCIFCKH